MMLSRHQQHKLQVRRSAARSDPEKFVEDQWSTIENAITAIFAEETSQLRFEPTFRAAYNLVFNGKGDDLYSRSTALIEKRVALLSSSVAAVSDDEFLDTLLEAWQRFHRAMLTIQDVLQYMETNYVPEVGRQSIRDAGARLFAVAVLDEQHNRTRAKRLALAQVTQDRVDGSGNAGNVYALCELLATSDDQRYVELIEKPLIAEAAEHFERVSKTMLANGTCPSYCEAAERLLSEERQRAKRFALARSTEDIEREVVSVLVAKPAKDLIRMPSSGAVDLFDREDLSSLRALHHLLSRDAASLDVLREVLVAHVKALGAAAAETASPSASEPEPYVVAVLALRRKCTRVLNGVAPSDDVLAHGLHKAFEAFLSACAPACECVASFVDRLMRRGAEATCDLVFADDRSAEASTSDASVATQQGGKYGVDALLDNIIEIFRYIADKDLFATLYRQHLARRLLSGSAEDSSGDSELELQFASRLKLECGFQYTAKIDAMFSDRRVSIDMNQEFTRVLARSRQPFAFSVHVLTTGVWPISAKNPCVLPAPMQAACGGFEDFYHQMHSGRKLTWVTSLGSAEVRTRFRARTHDLFLTTHQAMVLLRFAARDDAVSFGTLATETGLEESELKRTLFALSCGKHRVLIKQAASKKIDTSDSFTFNQDFTAKSARVRIGTVAATRERDTEAQRTRATVEGDRRPQIEAAIVRSMKAHRAMDHAQLVAEVTQQLADRFLPSPAEIKQRIESLIERDFLSRSDTDRRVYQYET